MIKISNFQFPISQKMLVRLAILVLIFSGIQWKTGEKAEAFGSAGISLNNGLVGYWTFDGKKLTSTTALDSSGQGTVGSFVGSPTLSIGKIGQALTFNGTSTYITTANAPSLQFNTGTLSAWIKTDNAGTSYRGIITKANAYSLYLKDNIFGVFDNGASAFRTTNTNLADNKWHHVVATFDSGVAGGTVLYIDGNLVSTTTMTMVNQAAGVAIARGAGGVSQIFTGAIDDVRAYNRILSADEVKQLYKMDSAKVTSVPTTAMTPSGTTGINNGIVAYWPLDSKNVSGATATDASGNGNNGTLIGSPTQVTGAITQALSFNGTSQAMSTTNLPLGSTQATSISFWYYTPTVPPSSNGIIFESSTNFNSSYTGFQMSLILNDTSCSNQLELGVRGDRGYNAKCYAPPEPGRWVHYVAVLDKSAASSSEVMLYKNGVLQSYQSFPPTLQFDNTNTFGNLPFYVMSRAGTSLFAKGQIDDLRVYNRALTQTEITQLYKTRPSKVANSFTTAATSSTATTGINKGLVGYWTFDGKNLTNATATDSSGSGNDGTLTSSPKPAIGKIGQGLKFNGSSQFVQVPYNANLAPTNSISFGAWFKVTDKTLQSKIISKTENGGYNMGFNDVTPGSFGTTVYIGGSYKIFKYDTANIQNNTWYHGMFTYDGSTMKLYLNGSLIGASSTTGFLGYTNNNVFCIGAEAVVSSCSADIFPGTIDDARVYNRALSASEVQQLYKLSGGKTGL